jgi:hypothetical protein
MNERTNKQKKQKKQKKKKKTKKNKKKTKRLKTNNLPRPKELTIISFLWSAASVIAVGEYVNNRQYKNKRTFNPSH